MTTLLKAIKQCRTRSKKSRKGSINHRAFTQMVRWLEELQAYRLSDKIYITDKDRIAEVIEDVKHYAEETYQADESSKIKKYPFSTMTKIKDADRL